MQFTIFHKIMKQQFMVAHNAKMRTAIHPIRNKPRINNATHIAHRCGHIPATRSNPVYPAETRHSGCFEGVQVIYFDSDLYDHIPIRVYLIGFMGVFCDKYQFGSGFAVVSAFFGCGVPPLIKSENDL